MVGSRNGSIRVDDKIAQASSLKNIVRQRDRQAHGQETLQRFVRVSFRLSKHEEKKNES